MSHQNKKSLVRQVQERYDSMLAMGQSKHQDKINHNTENRIYSWSTYDSYIKHANYFVSYCKSEHGCKNLEECRPYVDEWLQRRIDQNLSAYTIKLEAAALGKLYGCSTTEFIATPSRYRRNIQRSRGEKVRDAHFSEIRHKELVEFCKSTGLRRRELSVLTGDKLIEKNGKYYIVVDKGSKGGRYREAEVIGNIDNVRTLMDRAGKERVFECIPGAADIHGYRSMYATRIYNMNARPIESIKNKKELYICRADRKGTIFDKNAMQAATTALGHNRISVVAGHYIR